MTIRKLQKFTFYLLLILLPVNLAKHFFFDFSSVYGIYVDYLVPTLYLTDLLLITLIVLWFCEAGASRLKNQKSIRQLADKVTIQNLKLAALLFFLSIAGLSILGARNQPAAIYKWLKLLEFTLFTLWVVVHINLKCDFPKIVLALSMGAFYESLIAIFQWLKQGSLFGYYFLGEQPFSLLTPGIAKTSFLGEVRVRPYGTFSHPNVLGGYLALLLPWFVFRFIRQIKEDAQKYVVISYQLLVISMGMVGLFLSFSRAAWVVGVGGLLVIGYLKKYQKSKIKNQIFTIYYLLLTFILLLSLYLYPPTPSDLSWIRRLELNQMAVEMIKGSPLFGVGLNNFTVVMDNFGRVSGFARFLQPVHNIYLLVAAETGLLGLAAFVSLLVTSYWLLVKRAGNLLFLSLSQIILLGVVDHYFLTIQQGSLLFFLVLGLAFSLKNT